MKLFRIFAIAALAMVSSVSAQAGIVLSNMGSLGNTASYDIVANVNSPRLGAMKFTVGNAAFKLDSVTLAIFGGVDSTVQIVNADGANPGSTVFASVTQTSSQSNTIDTFSFSNLILDPNTSYFVTLSGPSDSAVAWSTTFDAPIVYGAGGLTHNGGRYRNGAGEWSNNNYYIAYSGSEYTPPAVPEPALTSLLCLSGIALIRRRMKK